MKGHGGVMHKIAFTLLLIGGLNWLAYGIFNREIGSLLGGMDSTPATIVYILVGLAALWEIFTHKNCCKNCGVDKPDAPSEPSEPEQQN